ncbi:MAG: competence/damage-inducible protein A [Planctomycetota bacterium]|nr:competence/damage-inducible protein A [Planctomycetota bacterium]
MPLPPVERCAAVISIGDELILGQTLDTNTAWIAAQLTELGVHVVAHETVADDQAALTEAIRRLAQRAGVLILTGGLGPTADDLTRPALAEALGDRLIEDTALLEQIAAYFRRFRREMPESNRSQAQRPTGAIGLSNDNGTAPGLAATLRRDHATRVWCLPGPPSEMQPMFARFVAPELAPTAEHIIRTRVLHTFGLGESAVAGLLGDLMNRNANPLVGTTASAGVVSCRIRYEGPEAGADDAVSKVERRLRELLQRHIVAEDDQTLAAAALAELERRKQMLVTVESCTGGSLGAALTDVPGSSAAYLGGWITYANEMKIGEVSVPQALLDEHGAVSEPVGRAMAEGALISAAEGKADHALAITGVAGPGGGSAEKPVGTVYIARASRSSEGVESDVRRFLFSGDRQSIRRWSVVTALAMLRFHLAGEDIRPLLREQT